MQFHRHIIITIEIGLFAVHWLYKYSFLKKTKKGDLKLSYFLEICIKSPYDREIARRHRGVFFMSTTKTIKKLTKQLDKLDATKASVIKKLDKARASKLASDAKKEAIKQKKAAKKATTKKPAAKKAVAKKPGAKRVAAKKPAAKKAATKRAPAKKAVAKRVVAKKGAVKSAPLAGSAPSSGDTNS